MMQQPLHCDFLQHDMIRQVYFKCTTKQILSIQQAASVSLYKECAGDSTVCTKSYAID